MASNASNRDPIGDGWRRRVRRITAGVAATAVVGAACLTGALAAGATEPATSTAGTSGAGTSGTDQAGTTTASGSGAQSAPQEGSESLVAPQQAPGSGSGRSHARSGGS